MSCRILAATDDSADGRHAVESALELAARARARVTILRVVAVPADGEIPPRRVERPVEGLGGHEVVVRCGIPGIEIGRLADERDASLIVVGRRPRTPDHRLLLGETADALVRRSSRLVLAVPAQVGGLESVLAALDGTDRCAQVLERARWFAETAGSTLSAVTVEPEPPGEPGGLDQPLRGRSLRVSALLERTARPKSSPPRLVVRRGNPIDQVLAEVAASRPSVLVVGYRRGGPPKTFGPTEIARNLLYAAPCAVLTVPL